MKLITLITPFLSVTLILTLVSTAQSESMECSMPDINRCGDCKVSISEISSNSAKISLSGATATKLINSGYLRRSKWERVIALPHWGDYFFPIGLMIMETGEIFKDVHYFLDRPFHKNITGLQPETEYNVILYSSWHKQLEIYGDRQNAGLENIKTTDPSYTEHFRIPFARKCFRTDAIMTEQN